jgi:hypothetical protein
MAVTDARVQEEALAALAALLEQGLALHLASLLILVAVIDVAARLASPYGLPAAFLVSAMAAVETYLAVRVGLDARLFRRLAEEARDGRLDFQAFDEGMRFAGLAPRRDQKRDVIERIRGGRALFARQAVATMAIAAAAGMTLFLAQRGV